MAPIRADSIRQQFGTQMPQGGHPPHHSITSSAVARNVGGTSSPSAFAVLILDSFFDCGGDWGTPKAFTLIPGPRQPSTDSFRNHCPLELGKHAHHLKHR